MGIKYKGIVLAGGSGTRLHPPIIEQDTQEVNHEMMPNDLVSMGRDIEVRVLYRAIKAHSERRVFLNENRTIVFRGQSI